MRNLFGTLAFVALGAAVMASSGCKVTCKDNEQDSGGQCIAKSLTKFNGTPVSKTIDYTAGVNLSVETVYGNVQVVKSNTAGKVEITFSPFNFQGYDEKDQATRQMNENLTLTAPDSGATDISVVADRTSGSTNGLGASVTVGIPDNFNGTIKVHNRGDGPIAGNGKEFDADVEYVATAGAVTMTNDAALGDCTIKGAASVKSTTANCQQVVTVLGVADSVNITTPGKGMDDPSVVLSVASVADTATGGTITVSEAGSINATFPSAGNYAIQATAPNGTVNEGTVPASCQKADNGATAKTVTCGTFATGGPIFKLSTQGKNDVFTEGTITLSYQ